MEKDATRYINNEVDDAAELNEEKLNDKEKEKEKSDRRIFRAFVISRENERIIAKSSSFERSNEGLNNFVC
jgi:hypothetical protein